MNTGNGSIKKQVLMNTDSRSFKPKNHEKGEAPKLSLNSSGFQPTLKKTNKTFVPSNLSKTVEPVQKPAEPVEEEKVSLKLSFF